MSKSDVNAPAALERLLSAYGFKQQKELAERLGIHANNVSSWLSRNVIPSSAFVQCALETGADISWLVKGEFANARLQAGESNLKGKSLYEEIMANGGKPVLRRLLDAYGFTMQKELGDLLDLSSGTISTWIRREYFPGDVVVACALDTGASLRWLATGKGEMYEGAENGNDNPPTKHITRLKLESGKLVDAGHWVMDNSLSQSDPESLRFVEGVGYSWLVNTSSQNIGNGRWFINIDDSIDVYDIARLPGGKLKLTNNALSFECAIGDIKPFGSVVFTLEKNS